MGLFEIIKNKAVFAKNLSIQMNRKKIDRKKLCADLGLKYSTVSEWLAGRKYPRIDKIEILAKYFGILKSDLIEDKTNKTKTIRDRASELSRHLTGTEIIGKAEIVEYNPRDSRLRGIAAQIDSLPEPDRNSLLDQIENLMKFYHQTLLNRQKAEGSDV